ncbi:MAG: diguanylate cyclase domain-containing protein [Hyphomicrobiales bacterium]
MPREALGGEAAFLSTVPAGRFERRTALAFVLVSTVVFVIIAPNATRPLPPVRAFIPAYEAALVLNDLITAAFLLGQFNAQRTRGLLLLACAYLFTAALAVSHLLSFPGLLATTGLIGAGPQTTAWLYMFWHAGFPILLIAYALSQDRRIADTTSARTAMLGAVAMTLGAAVALASLATAGQDALPAIMQANHYRPAMAVVISTVWLLSFAALLLLLRRRPYCVLDLWLIVVICAWLFDIALSAALNAGRFDLGFYAGRVYGLMAASFILLVLLTHNGILYARLIAAHERERRQAAELLRLSTTDPLTGIANRRAFEQALDSEWRRTMRYKTPLSLMMIDVDFFKRFNDTYGHVAGDECLRRVAEVLASHARRAADLAARYGGEEFAILLPHTETAEARRLAERVCQSVRQLAVPHAASAAADHVTVSIGVAGAAAAMRFEPEQGAPGTNDNRRPIAPPAAATLVESADRALYAAKEAGRNRACALSDDGEPDTAVQPAA